jgi:hypothetical protein
VLSFLAILFIVEQSAESYGKCIYSNATLKLNQINLSFTMGKFKSPAMLPIPASILLSCSLNCLRRKKTKNDLSVFLAESDLTPSNKILGHKLICKHQSTPYQSRRTLQHFLNNMT